MKSKIKVVLKMIYVLIPRIIRQQFIDDALFLYRENFSRLINKTSKKKDKSLDLIFVKEFNLVQNIEDLKCDYEILFSQTNRQNNISSPKLYLEGNNYFKPNIEGTLPDINIYRFKNVSVVGSTDSVVFGNKFFHKELNLMEPWHDLKRWDIFKQKNKDKYELTLKQNEESINSKQNKKYISLLKEHSINYYHFMTEVLPRLVQIVDSVEILNLKDYILLVDNDMPKQCLEAIELVLNDTIEIIFVNKAEIFYCEELIYCTPLWMSFDNTKGLPNFKDYFVDKYAIDLVRNKILSNFKIENEGINRFRKVYLQRLNNKLRPIKNIHKLEMLMLKNGFEFLDIGVLSLKEQIQLFQTVDIVVGASGASFTNLLFMKENSISINICPSVPSTNYYVFQPLADIAKVEFIHFLTIPSTDDLNLHAEAYVDLDYLNLLIKEKCNNVCTSRF